jgi:hypothetical protein
VELDSGRDVVEIAAREIVASDDLVALGQKGIGQMTAKKTSDAADKDLHSCLRRMNTPTSCSRSTSAGIVMRKLWTRSSSDTAWHGSGSYAQADRC